MVLNAVGAGAMFTSFVTHAADIIPVTRRAQGLAWFAVWGMMANGISPLVAEWLQRSAGFRAYFLTAAALSVACTAIIMAIPSSRPRHSEGPAVDAPASRSFGSGFLLILTFLFGAAEASVFTFLAPFLAATGERNVGPVFFAYAGAAVFVRVVSGYLPDPFGRLRVLAASFALYGSALLAMPRVSGELAHLITGVLAGTGHGYAFPILAAQLVDLAGGRRGRALSWFTAMFDLGHSLSNPLLGALAGHFGYWALYSSVGVISLGCAALIVGKSRPPWSQDSISIR